MFKSRKTEAGFTLVELLIGLALLTLLATSIMISFNGARSRAQALLNILSEGSNGLVRLKNDTGCYPKYIKGLYDNTVNTSDKTWCGKAFDKTWNGPYVTSFPTVGDGLQASLDNVAAGITMEIVREDDNTDPANPKKIYMLRAKEVPSDVAKQYLQECNHDDAVVDNFSNGRCRVPSEAPAGAETTWVDFKWDEVRTIN